MDKAKYVEVPEKEMRDGDWVEFTYYSENGKEHAAEGELYQYGERGSLFVASVAMRYSSGASPKYITINRVLRPRAPLPTEFGSVVRDNEGRDWVLVYGDTLGWVTHDGSSATPRALEREDFKVIRVGYGA